MKIRPRGKGWQLDCGKINGHRVQLSFQTKEAAAAEMAMRKGELRRVGHAGFSLTDEERIRCVAALERLAGVKATIEEAVEFFIKHAKPGRGEVTFEELRTLCLEAKYEQGVRPRYHSQLGVVARAFGAAGHDALSATGIAAAHVEAWLKSNQWASKTWNNYRTDLRTIFSWALEQGYVTMNPVDAVPRKQPDVAEGEGEGDVEFLPVAAAERLLQRAARAMDGELMRDRRGLCKPQKTALEDDYRTLLPAIVIGLFAGLRPEREVGRMTWKAILLDEALVVVTVGRSKTRERRTVDLSPNAVAWLRWCQSQGLGAESGERILPPNFTRRWRALRKACGLVPWPHDGLRHTFATMHLAHFRDEGKLQLYMGHTSAALIYSNYRGLVKPAEAAKFWELRPLCEK